jgi:hypothetical protein
MDDTTAERPADEDASGYEPPAVDARRSVVDPLVWTASSSPVICL